MRLYKNKNKNIAIKIQNFPQQIRKVNEAITIKSLVTGLWQCMKVFQSSPIIVGNCSWLLYCENLQVPGPGFSMETLKHLS